MPARIRFKASIVMTSTVRGYLSRNSSSMASASQSTRSSIDSPRFPRSPPFSPSAFLCIVVVVSVLFRLVVLVLIEELNWCQERSYVGIAPRHFQERRESLVECIL
ncbi:hypothetical protein J1614_010739 [Plenodomus biglobosus]|nr:hypothetical protein J1614_010739 [Plenodomus biglobosus]